MEKDSTKKPLSKVIRIDESEIRRHLDGMVRGTVEETLNTKLNQKVYKHIERWRTAPIEGSLPYVYLDGLVLKRSWSGEVKNVSVLS